MKISEDIRIPFGWPLWVLNLVLTLLVTLLHVVEAVTLPLWIGSYPHKESSTLFEIEQEMEMALQKRSAADPGTQHVRNVSAVNNQLDRHFSTDPYFVLSFAMLVSTVVYGSSLLSYNMCRTPGKVSLRKTHVSVWLVYSNVALANFPQYIQSHLSHVQIIA